MNTVEQTEELPASVLERGRELIENVDVAEIRADIEDSIRARPFLSICLAAAAGFLVGRLIRD